MIRSIATLSFLLSLVLFEKTTLAQEEEESCKDIDDTDICGTTAPQERDEIALGLNALPARMAVVTGQIQVPQKCGAWCTSSTQDPASPCMIDTNIVPCDTDFYCTTTCALWSLFTTKQEEQRPTISCAMFVRFDGYPTYGAEPCDEACLLPEIRKERYPAPTGIGLLCQTGTCYASGSSMAAVPEVAAILECPCNWFGSDCPDDWVPIQAVNHTAVYGDLVATTLTVNTNNWKTIIAHHQPGGVIRISQRDPQSGRVSEQPYALAYAPSEGKLEILTAPPDMSLHPFPRAVAERVRSLPSGPISADGNQLFINPSIAGFFNKEWTFLLDELKTADSMIKRVVVLSTGAGLSGALSAVEAAITLAGLKDIHLYHGLRNAKDLPYKDRLNELSVSEGVDLAIIESKSSGRGGVEEAEGIVAGLQRGAHSLAKKEADDREKVYVQHVVGADLMPGGTLYEKGASLQNTVFVVCGRMALLQDSYSILQSIFCTNDSNDCDTNLLGRRFFTNI